MLHLIKNEFIKIKRNKVFHISFFIVALSPMFSFFIMSLSPHDFVRGDFNIINIILLSLVGSRTIFPVIAMTLVKLEYDISGYGSTFVTPIRRSKVILAKAFTALIWMIMLIVISIILVIASEVIVFGDFEIKTLLISTLNSYFYLIVYAFPIQIFGMLLTFILNSVLIPSILFGSFIIIEYFIRISGSLNFTPCFIPEFISGSLEFSTEIIVAFSMIVIFGLLSLFLLNYLIREKDFLN